MSWGENRKGPVLLIPGTLPFPSLQQLGIGPIQTLVQEVTISTGITRRHYVITGWDIGMDEMPSCPRP